MRHRRGFAGECERYEQLVEQTGGVDIQLLGIGNNGSYRLQRAM